jgi:aryl-alcohol dehydrogenase-like predicted oxidoreductase
MANEAARARHYLGLVSEQCKYNLLVRSVELEVLPACERYGLGVIPYSPLAGGLLGGALRKASEGRRSSEQAVKDIARLRPQLEAWEGLCAEVCEKPADVALAWLLHNPIVTAPIIGPRNAEQLDGTLRALEIELTGEVVGKLDEIFPGPGVPGPEAWAW